MAPLSAASTLFASSTSLANLSSSRHRPPSTAAPRKEGWTEVWGSKNRDGDNGDGKTKVNGNDDGDAGAATAAMAMEMPYLPPRYITVMDDGCDCIDGRDKSDAADGKAQDSPIVKLTQHRVAWFEQMVLRMNHIPHSVENSGYSANESTGGLPCLLDVTSRENREDGRGKEAEKDNINDDGDAWKKTFSKLDKPVLIGRNQPGGLGSGFFQQFQQTRKSTTSADLQPLGFLPSGSHIVDYLRLKHSHEMKENLLFPEHLRGTQAAGDAMAYESLIQDKLNYILLSLRYGNDPAWEGVYRPQCIRSALDPNGEYADVNGRSKRKSFFPLWAWYQAYSERSLALHNLLPNTHAVSPSTHGGLAFELFRYNDYRQASQSISSESEGCDNKDDDDDDDSEEKKELHQHHPFSSFFASRGGVGGGDTGRVNVYRAMELADMLYASLDERLAASSSSGVGDSNEPEGSGGKKTTYFLGTERPTYIDALLFAHLAEALCDVHLVLVLAKHSRLLKYFQFMYDKYFGEGYATSLKSSCVEHGADTSTDSWIQKNNVINALNAFNQIPEATASKPTSKGIVPVDNEGHDMVHAIQLMQQMAIHCNELDEALRDAATLRTTEGEEKAVLASYHRPMGSTLYQWIMGSDISFWGSGKTKSEGTDDGVTDDERDGDDDDVSQSGDGEEKEPTPEEEDKQRMYRGHVSRMKRDRRAHDELWLSGVAVVVVCALVISASGKKR